MSSARSAKLAGNGTGITAEQLTEIRDFVSKGKSIREAIESRKPVDWTDQATQTARVLKYLQDAQTHNKALIKDLTERRDKREEALRERQGKLLDLESRLKLGGIDAADREGGRASEVGGQGQDSAAEVSGVAAFAHGNFQGRQRTAPQPGF